MTYLSVEQLSKSFGHKPLFENLTFGIARGDKTALVAPNGTGKSTLLKVLAGKLPPDSGEVMISRDIRTGILEQEPELDDRLTIREFISSSHSDTMAIIRNYEAAAQAQAEDFNEETSRRFEKALADMEAAGAWDYEQRMQQILGKLSIVDLNQSISSLSGGERKRVALAFVLLESPDLLLLDEPTNHLDVDMIEWLEEWLVQSTTTLFMVTHDRYFLDRVCNHIIELDAGNLYHHKGNYQYYLQKKAERLEIEATETDKAGQLYKKELEWMRRAPKARTGKSKSRIDAFYETAKKAGQKRQESELRLEVNMARMGNKILVLSNIDKRFGDTTILDGYSYSFKRGERIGVIGRNGAGKSTFLKLLTGEEPVDAGEIDTGSTIVFGHYRQKGIEVDESMRVIEVLREVADVIEMADGRKITASQFLEHFMFTPEMQYTVVSSLSGGERRRLGLMMVLMKNPNFLILDEPTNDLDLDTLNRLEEFLLGFGGCLIIVSHDRFFMDKLVQHYFVFEGDGIITDFHGTYQEYRQELTERRSEERSLARQSVTERETLADNTSGSGKVSSGKKSGSGGKEEKQKTLSFKERKEYQKLEREIEQLEEERSRLEEEISAGIQDYQELTEKSQRFGELQEVIDEKTMRWLELAELA